MIVGGRQGVLIAEADAMLPQMPPRLDRANIDPSGVGGVADRPQYRFDPAAAARSR
jgi:hypothetical protein